MASSDDHRGTDQMSVLVGLGAEVSGETRERANALYWGSAESVNRLAQELDLSKGALYDIVEPFPAGVPCPSGDGELVYVNRTARDRGFVHCPTCGLEEEEGRVREQLARFGYVPEVDVPDAGARPRPRRALERLLVGSALAGATVGFLAARILRRR